ncbi:hypothetical protein MHSWG343_05600 [Candidatus Mycoplasma haematohominis]|uniref:Uncharacterized protein n=1 Tax=Candidatus Mycoplasma haematohominis TaxID=1494318 RepID=A0A478FQ46_9MOLU|nr:hypothetical protein MHSWG343_05600 [Candidatus Mycoplasma haemohominis]
MSSPLLITTLAFFVVGGVGTMIAYFAGAFDTSSVRTDGKYSNFHEYVMYGGKFNYIGNKKKPPTVDDVKKLLNDPSKGGNYLRFLDENIRRMDFPVAYGFVSKPRVYEAKTDTNAFNATAEYVNRWCNWTKGYPLLPIKMQFTDEQLKKIPFWDTFENACLEAI